MECVTTGFSATEVGLLLTAIMGMVGLPVGLQFRAMREDNKYLRDLLSDQLEIARDQNQISKATVETVKTLRNSRRT